ncbi:galactoside 2-alpha-L-fucosyltransferase SEC1-like [Gigantopelta aegis]|uniref:galactoside 2-alpha-L-fucosyltransferase SEC1-like n=1 Tax=Gigantopelta aegis TaxID=1735272 RepID=UPI001B88C578|nr:galactoside 2-alpha-L-fucosyltransferase SEC1-like [Gigantopelta aegis]
MIVGHTNTDYLSGLAFFFLVFAVISGVYYIQVKIINLKPIVKDILNTQGNKTTYYICDAILGRLGNQLFTYASSYGIAKDKNMTMVTAKDRMLNHIFMLDAVEVDEGVCAKFKLLEPHACCIYDKIFLNSIADTNYKLGNYLQSWKYFQNHVAAIRRQFRFIKPIMNKTQTFLHGVMDEYKRRTSNSTNAENVTLVGVHIRQGDMKRPNSLRFGYILVPKEYITKAMQYFTNKFSKVIFLICSDSMDWVKSHFNSSNIFYSVGNSPEVDMCLLSSCNHSIMTVGTFGWWASFLADGETVYYKHTAREGSRLRKEYSANYSDYFYPGWIGMD